MKPSIFSRDYEKRVKKIRIRRTIIALAIILICSIGYLNYSKNINFSGIKKGFNAIITSIANNTKKQTNKQTKTVVKNTTKSKTQTTKKKNVTSQEQSYPIKLSDGSEIKAIYETNNNSINFKYISPIESNTEFSISPSSKALVVFDKNSQSILFMGTDGNVIDITKNDYKAESDGKIYAKADELKIMPTYIWCSSPKFVDENTIAFVSQLPYLDQNGQQFIWLYNITTKEYKCLYNNGANSIKFDKITDKGLTVILDTNTKYLKGDGTLSD